MVRVVRVVKRTIDSTHVRGATIRPDPTMYADLTLPAFIAVPIAFGYAILRHRLPALDALLRRAVSRISAELLMVSIFIVLRELFRWLGTTGAVAGGLAAAFVALVAPAIWLRTREFLEAKLFPRIAPSLSSQLLYESGTVAEVCSALVGRAPYSLHNG